MKTPISPKYYLRQRTGRRSPHRIGSATVELAIVLPVFMVMLFGSLEVCHRLFIRQSVVLAAYETARTASRQTATTAAVASKCAQLLQQSEIEGATVQIRDITRGVNHLDSVVTGDEIRIRISVPWGANSISRFVVSDQGSVVVDAVMLRE
jgi:sensor histidine kinase regulating citrate/malate metabolism